MMEKLIHISNMSCGHCVKSIDGALRKVAGVQDVKVDLPSKTAIVSMTENVSNEALKQSIEDAGYEISNIQ